MNIQWPDVGAFLHEGNSCTFILWAPEAEKVELLVNGNKYSPEKLEHGYYSITLPDITEGTRYQYRIDDSEPMPDPASRHQPDGVHGASAVVGNSFVWTDHQWKGMNTGELIIYEIHTGTFTPSGSFYGIIEKLPYLQSLGVNAIELMPVVGFAGNRNWGYDLVCPFAVHETYGAARGLKELVNAAHETGIAVILDVICNHLGPEGNYLTSYGPYLTEKYKTPWGPAINYDDEWADGVRHYYWQNALMWLNEFHIDGLRLDAVHAIRDFSADHFIAVLQRKVNMLEQECGRKKFLIAEMDLNDPKYISDTARGGYGLAAQWIDEFHHALHSLVTKEKNGYYEDFGEPWHLVKSIRDSYVYTGQFSVHRKKHFGVPAGDLPYGQFVVFAQNHDQVGNRKQGNRLSTMLPFECLKLVAGTVLLSPHIPLLFMGEEYGEKNPFLFFVNYSDEQLREATKKGREEEFSYFKDDSVSPDPNLLETFQQSRLSWNTGEKQAAALFSYYQYLINLRKTRAALRCLDRKHLQILPVEEEGLIGFSRTSGKEQLLIFLNFNPAAVTTEFPLSGGVSRIFDSSSVEWGGEEKPAKDVMKDTWQINPYSVVIFEKQL
ncbi:MAG: malto-oligosyltrehalose trehalohydrolase [Pseudobacter sp.]|uniref:malto-oligosyltrehalose trehalohydrolase n=1 Tax=Pseudobacter sp. TaxID=2045420 RepID=UPI003F7FD483